MTEDRTNLQWARLAAAIKAAREARGLRQIDLAELAGISEGSIQNLEDPDRRPSRMPQSLAKVEPHLGWSAGSGVAILKGGEPTLLATNPRDGRRDSQGRIRGQLPLRIVDELESDDPLLDSAVIELPGVDGARMTVVVRGNPNATPEQIQEALLAWRKAERRLQRLSVEEGSDTPNPRAANGS
ncbi:helix-turn-helix domain-containing protein [Streptomyces achromogenes]|uniref:helix-turn-helix domain-containing protein n=1 Tax=Streptomyces achromogenes TaxID=67255 RepID=UPI003432E47B